MYKGSLFSTSSPTFIICKLFDDSHSDRCEVISYGVLVCISVVISDVEHLFMCLLAIFVTFVKNVSSYYIISLKKFFFLLLCCMMTVILNINGISVIWFVSIFPYCLFILLLVSFAVPKLLNLIRSHFSLLLLFPLPYETDPPKIVTIYVKKYLPMISSRSFMVSSLTFRTLIHVELFFFNVIKCSDFTLLQCNCPVFPIPVCSCLFCCRLTDCRCKIYSWLSMLFHWSMSVFVPILYCSDYCGFVV